MIKLEVFVHSHFETGEPIEVDVFTADGIVDLVWLFHIFDKEHKWHCDLAALIHERVKITEESVWIECEPMNDGMPCEWWIEYIKEAKND
jgi:hypothetical protein